ncbi:UDP-N-acetylglucosamine pyrophosphorylase [Giardia muris]|uniref:UDP-N-acetylglucosamine diphosphorylase n=1 Tax=Giardia muris TaxID=5742 RepID=A0A4Z1SX85_GIAMU|nr:UDP-N-acetylglucosamine pyrophosphorylase [Giardia muris]|eukprot:TNJ28138.1 UDP-N-acetylglucosamine pyrophosphorylase [Giardia muris]
MDLATLLEQDPCPQPRLAAYVQTLSTNARVALLHSAEGLDLTPALRFSEIREAVDTQVDGFSDLGDRSLNTIDDSQVERVSKAQVCGRELLNAGAVACLILAGGQATRLGATVPKGVYEINFGPEGSCLLEILLRRLRSLSSSIPLILLVSSATEAETRGSLVRHEYFGYDPNLIHFCVQGAYPVVNEQGELVLSEPLKLATAPNGNAGFFDALRHTGLITKLKAQGVRYIHVTGVDNPLMPLCDPTLIGHAGVHDLDVVNMVVPAISGKKEGIVGLRHVSRIWQAPLVSPEVDLELPMASPSVLEYSELPPDFVMTGRYANIISHVFSLEYLAQLSVLAERAQAPLVPYHLAHKKATYYDYVKRMEVTSTEPCVYKFESLIFDIFHFCPIEKFGLVISARERVFAPIKNATGEDSIETARMAYHNALTK